MPQEYQASSATGYPALVGESAYLIATHGANALSGFVFWVLAGRFYPQQAVGLVAGTISASGLLAMLGTLGLDYAVVRFLPQEEDGERLVGSSLGVVSLTTLLLAAVFLGALNVWAPGLRILRRDPLLGGGLVILTVLSALGGILTGVFLSRTRARFILAHSAIFGGARIVLVTALALLVTSRSAVGLIGAWVLALAAATACDLAIFLPRSGLAPARLRLSVSAGHIRAMARFAFANYLTTILWTAPGLVLPLLIVNLAGLDATASFYIAWNVGGLLGMVPTAVSMVLFAHGSHDATDLSERAVESGRLALLLLCPAVAGVVAFGRMVLSAFGPAYAQQGTPLLWVLALSTFPLTVNVLFFGVRRVHQKMAGVVGASAWILVLTLGLAALVVPRLGPLGAGVAWFAAQTSVASVLMARYVILHRAWRESPAAAP